MNVTKHMKVIFNLINQARKHADEEMLVAARDDLIRIKMNANVAIQQLDFLIQSRDPGADPDKP